MIRRFEARELWCLKRRCLPYLYTTFLHILFLLGLYPGVPSCNDDFTQTPNDVDFYSARRAARLREPGDANLKTAISGSNSDAQIFTHLSGRAPMLVRYNADHTLNN
jgi:hypothetical protein